MNNGIFNELLEMMLPIIKKTRYSDGSDAKSYFTKSSKTILLLYNIMPTRTKVFIIAQLISNKHNLHSILARYAQYFRIKTHNNIGRL